MRKIGWKKKFNISLPITKRNNCRSLLGWGSEVAASFSTTE
jgi:hypothetical protein